MAGFKERLLELFEEAKDKNYKINRNDFANMIGATRSQLNGWLDKGSEPDIAMLIKIAKRSGVSVSWLVGETDFRFFSVSVNQLYLPVEAKQEFDYMVKYLKYKYDKKRKQKGDVAE